MQSDSCPYACKLFQLCPVEVQLIFLPHSRVQILHLHIHFNIPDGETCLQFRLSIELGFNTSLVP